jgi:hypothetical protein
MNSRDSVKTRAEAVEKRYSKTTKGTAPRKPKPKLKLKPVLGKNKIGIKGKITF